MKVSLRWALVATAGACLLAACSVTSTTVSDPAPTRTGPSVQACIGATAAVPAGTSVSVGLEGLTTHAAPVTVTVPGTVHWSVPSGVYRVTVNGQTLSAVTVSDTSDAEVGSGVGCPAPTVSAAAN